MIRRNQKNCITQLFDYDQIINGGGYNVYTSEYKRYERKGFGSPVKSEAQWAVGMREAAERGQQFWAMTCEDKMVAYAVCQMKEQHVDLVTWKCDYDNYKQFYPSYGLLYAMINHYLSKEDIRFVSDGSRSLTEHSSVQDFLIEKFKFRKAYTKLNAVFRWWLYPILFILAPFEKYIKQNQIRSLVRLYKWSR